MNLAEAKCLEVTERAQTALESAIEAWRDHPPSEMSDHALSCCAIAREWLFAMDRSHTPASEPFTGPRWIRQRVSWGPSRWPLYWCEALAAKMLDCGALAALAKNVFRERGVTAHTVQLIQQFTKTDGHHWACSWARGEVAPNWIRDDVVYHEACGVIVRDQLRIWDPTASWWMNPKHVAGYSGALAIRVLADPEGTTTFLWGTHRISANEWHPLQLPPTQQLALVTAA